MIDLHDLPAGWAYCHNRWTVAKGRAKIYKDRDDGTFCISQSGVWMPGCFASLDAALFAFKLDDEILSALQTRKNAENGGCGGVITIEDLKAPQEAGGVS